MNEIILLKLGEMVLKGLNRRSFEDKLQANLHRRLRPFGQFRVYTRQSATYVEPIGEGCDVEGAYEALKHVFGIVGLSLARPCGKDKDAILACAKEFLDDQLRAARTFKVESIAIRRWLKDRAASKSTEMDAATPSILTSPAFPLICTSPFP